MDGNYNLPYYDYDLSNQPQQSQQAQSQVVQPQPLHQTSIPSGQINGPAEKDQIPIMHNQQIHNQSVNSGLSHNGPYFQIPPYQYQGPGVPRMAGHTVPIPHQISQPHYQLHHQPPQHQHHQPQPQHQLHQPVPPMYMPQVNTDVYKDKSPSEMASTKSHKSETASNSSGSRNTGTDSDSSTTHSSPKRSPNQLNAKTLTRPLLKRSRLGCITCRQRKKRCSETKPRCIECTRLRLNCVWPIPGTEHKNKSKELKEEENVIHHEIYGKIKVLRGIVEYKSDEDPNLK